MKSANLTALRANDSTDQKERSFVSNSKDSVATASSRWQKLANDAAQRELFGTYARNSAPQFRKNIENYIGTVNIPVGLVNSLRVLGSGGDRTYDIPLATTEAALVASYNRGARLLTQAGGCTARVVASGLSRTPMFAFTTLTEAHQFAVWSCKRADTLKLITAEVTRHGRFQDCRAVIEGNHVYLDISFETGDAAGQNMVTFTSDAICQWLAQNSPVKPRYWFLEANMSGDKKASAQVLRGVRGKRVIAEVTVAKELLKRYLRATPEQMVDYWIAGAIGGVMSGSKGMQGHYANGLAALYLACGQDVACVAESAVGVTRLEVNETGDLYASVTLPNIIVGTVGGGTGLPFAKACLDILGLDGEGHCNPFAEVCAALVLAGELSIVGAFCSGDFARAHHHLSRGVVGREGHSHE